MEMPPEMGYPSDMVGLLKKSLYGTRDAPANWEAAIKDVMLALGFLQAKSNACLYFHEERNIRIEVHGDDFTGVGPKSELEWFAAELKKEVLDLYIYWWIRIEPWNSRSYYVLYILPSMYKLHQLNCLLGPPFNYIQSPF